jgi:hypothetical protein
VHEDEVDVQFCKESDRLLQNIENSSSTDRKAEWTCRRDNSKSREIIAFIFYKVIVYSASCIARILMLNPMVADPE